MLAAFARHGVPVISSDEIVHELLADDVSVIESLRSRWGDQVTGARGEIDRKKVGAVVFEDRVELEWLERVLHPRVVDRYLTWRDDLGRQPKPPDLCVIEIPLLYEAGSEADLDAVLAVTAPSDVRRDRVSHATDEREQRLLPESEKRRRADFTYENVGTLEELDAFVTDLIRELSAWSGS